MHTTPKIISANLGTGVTAGATVTSTFDRLGYDHAIIVVQIEGTSATTAPTEVKLTDSDDNTTFAAITRFTGGTGFTIPTALRTLGDPLGPSNVVFSADMRALGRYVKVTVAAGGTNHIRYVAFLTRGDENPHTAAAGALPTATRDVLVVG